MEIHWFIYINGLIFTSFLGLILGHAEAGWKMAVTLITSFTLGFLLWSGVI